MEFTVRKVLAANGLLAIVYRSLALAQHRRFDTPTPAMGSSFPLGR